VGDLPLESLHRPFHTELTILSQLAALHGWLRDAAMLSLIVVAVLVTHALFNLVERFTRTWHGSERPKA